MTSNIIESFKALNDSSSLKFGEISIQIVDSPSINELIDELNNNTQLNRSEIINTIGSAGEALLGLSLTPEQITPEIVDISFELINNILNQPDELLSEAQISSNALTK